MNNGKLIGNFFDRWDYFSESMPQFNMEGKKKVGTLVGCIYTVLLLLIICSYSIIRMYFFVTQARPLISSYTLHDMRTEKDKIDLREHKF